jgi:U3 small nucleolar RNA-associated protein 14
MSDDESINSNEIPSDKSSDSSIEDEQKEEKALSNLKQSLNLEQKYINQKPEKQENDIKRNKIYFLENTSLNETEKNVQTTKSQKINFSDVFKTFQGNIKNETSRANLSRAVKNFGISENENEYKENDDENNKNKLKNDKRKKKEEVNRIVNNYKEQKEEKKLEREASYLAVGEKITGYQGKVKSLREADVVDFTQDDPKKVRHVGQKSLKEIASSNKGNKKGKKNSDDDMNSKINQILINNNCITDDKILEQEQKELKNINPEELKRRYDELKQIRARLLQKEIENKRKAKIKSKLYHKIKKNKKIKEENDLLEQLGQIDPEAVQEYIEKKKIDRVQERMQLKHSLNSKFQKTIKRYHFDKDQQVKEAIKDNFQLRDKLLQRIQGKENDDDAYEENEDNYDENEENENDEESKEGIHEKNGEKNVIMNFDEKKDNTINNKKKEECSINDKTGVFSMPFMKNAENLDIQNKIEKLKNKLNNTEELDDYDKIEKEDYEESESEGNDESVDNNDKTNKKSKIKKKNTQKAPVITKDTLKKINEDTKKINEANDKNQKVDIKFDTDTLQQMINEENINEDINTFNNFLIENEINKQEFLENENKEQLEEIKKNNPEFIAGWGSWAGDDNEIKVKEFLKKKRYEEKIKRLKEQASEGKNNKFVKISNQVDQNFSQFLVQELPNDMINREQFERFNKTLIGREVNSLNLYKKLIQPKIVKKIGQIINPMTANDSTKGMQLQEIIEKVTKKKKFTKAKL